MKKTIPIQTTQFVLGTDFFRGFSKLWDDLSQSSNFTWGDANRTLYTADAILNELSNNANVNYKTLERFQKRCESVGLQTYVDLEN